MECAYIHFHGYQWLARMPTKKKAKIICHQQLDVSPPSAGIRLYKLFIIYFFFFILPTAREALWLPAISATSLYVKTLPRGIFATISNTISLNFLFSTLCIFFVFRQM